jgi:hypothetical protein
MPVFFRSWSIPASSVVRASPSSRWKATTCTHPQVRPAVCSSPLLSLSRLCLSLSVASGRLLQTSDAGVFGPGPVVALRVWDFQGRDLVLMIQIFLPCVAMATRVAWGRRKGDELHCCLVVLNHDSKSNKRNEKEKTARHLAVLHKITILYHVTLLPMVCSNLMPSWECQQILLGYRCFILLFILLNIGKVKQ